MTSSAIQVSFGHLLTLSPRTGTSFRYQNFFINEVKRVQGEDYAFLPFNFSGGTINRAGDNIEATVAVANNQLARDWATQSAVEHWVVSVQLYTVDLAAQNYAVRFMDYTGQVSSAGWNTDTVGLRISTLIDAVGKNVPVRVLHQHLVGNLPHSANVLF